MCPVVACFPLFLSNIISINSLPIIQDAKHKDKKAEETFWFIQTKVFCCFFTALCTDPQEPLGDSLHQGMIS